MLLETAVETVPGTREAAVIASSSPIALDYTLHHLYSLDGNGASVPTLVFNASPAPDHGLSSPVKFAYHTSFSSASTADPSQKLSPKTLPQRYAFSAGRMPVVIVGLEPPSSRDPVPADHDNLYRAFSQLRHDQQPLLSILARPDQLVLPLNARIAVTRPIDCLAHLPHVVDPEAHYEMLSKRGLALSGLPTPPSTVIDALVRPEHVHDAVQLQAEVARMTTALDARPLPFMVKLNQSLAGKGIMAVRCEADRARTKAIVGAKLRAMLPQLNAVNQGLHPCSVVLQDYLVGAAVSLSLFVTPNGRAVFIVCSDQHFEDNGYWAGGSVLYADQKLLRQRYAQPMAEAARFLHDNGYYGPAGIDIMTDGSGAQYIIDINARITGSYHLGPLAGHFVRRGLWRATAVKKHFLCSRAVFEAKFVREIQQGHLIVTGWARDEALSLSQGAVTVGGRDAVDVESLLAKVQAHAISPESRCGKQHESNAVTCSNAHQANMDAYAGVCNTLVN